MGTLEELNQNKQEEIFETHLGHTYNTKRLDLCEYMHGIVCSTLFWQCVTNMHVIKLLTENGKINLLSYCLENQSVVMKNVFRKKKLSMMHLPQIATHNSTLAAYNNKNKRHQYQ